MLDLFCFGGGHCFILKSPKCLDKPRVTPEVCRENFTWMTKDPENSAGEFQEQEEVGILDWGQRFWSICSFDFFKKESGRRDSARIPV